MNTEQLLLMSNEQLAVSNVKIRGNRASFLIFLFSLLLVFSCHDPVSSVKLPPLPAGKGSFSLTLSGGAGRTVLPNTPNLSDFAVYSLGFTPVNGGAAANVDRSNAALAAEPVLLEPGTYNLVVNAYKDANKTQLAARGTLDGIVITAGKNTSALVTLEALLSGGTGTFRWAITLPAGVSAAMTIAPESAGGTNQQTVTLTAPQAAGSCTLNSGSYNLTFTLEKTGGRPVEWRELLYVYQSLESVFSFTFTDAHFTDPIYTVTFNSNGGAPGTWGQSVLHGATVEMPADPTKRGYAVSGWYSDNNSFANVWDFDSPVIESFTLFAEWELVTNVPGATLAAKLSWLQNNALSDIDYTVEVSADENIEPHTLSYSGRSNVGITLIGIDDERVIGLSSNGSLFTVASGVTLVLGGNITLQGLSGNNTSLVRVNAGGTLVMNEGSVVTGNTCTSSSYGGGVYVTGSNAAFTMNGGNITGNSVTYYGGGVYASGGAAFTMSGGAIHGNTSTSTSSSYGGGGGVYVTGSSTAFTMAGGAIHGNSAAYSGGGVYMNSSAAFAKTGGTIYGYSADDPDNSNAVKNSSGTVQSGRGHAVYATANSIIKRKEYTAGPGVNLSWNGTVNPPTRSGDWDNYIITFSVNGGSGTAPSASNVNAGSGVSLPSGSGLTMSGYTFGGWNTIADGTGDNYSSGSSYTPDGDITLYAKWNLFTNIPPGATLADKLAYLRDNALSDVDYTVEVSADEDIAPHTLSYSNRSNVGITLIGVGVERVVGLSSNGSLFTVPSGVTLVLDENITLQGLSDNNASLVRVNAGGTLVMNAGSAVTGNTCTSSTFGGGVYVTGTNAAFTMNGGNITGNSVTYSGGGVYASGGAAFTMSGGAIHGNTSTSTSSSSGGGGVYVTGSSTAFTMAGGAIHGNTASNYGGGVYAGGGTFAMNDGTISGNTSSSYGGGVYVGSGTFTKTGGTVYGYSEGDTDNSNAVKNSSGTVQSSRGHAVYATANSIIKRKEFTAGPAVNLSWNGTVNPPTRSGDWDNYIVIYSVNGGNGTALGANNVNAGSGVSLPSGSGLTKPGRAFGGWNTEADGTGENRNAGSSYTPDGDITLYAKWDLLAYTVAFDINGGTGAAPAPATNTGSGVILPGGSGLSKDGYAFGDWNTNESGTGTTYQAGSNYTPAVSGNVTLYARWVTPPAVDMVFVPGGSFEMGRNLGTGGGSDATPVHPVTLSGFYMGKYEVTQAQYQTVMGTNPSNFKGSADSPNRPVETVSWYDAVVFCNKLSEMTGLTPAYRISNSTNPDDWGSVPTSSNSTWNAVTIESGSTGYRLPTEAQWEYAAKGGDPLADGWVGYTYAGSDDPDEVAWYSGNSSSRTHEVGTKAANGLGIYDMSGNVWEWCWDWYGSYSSGAQTDPTGASSGSHRVGRGGLWDASAEYVRSAGRSDNNPDYRHYGIGFRLVRP